MTTVAIDGARVFVAGHRGMVGSAIVRRLKDENCDILTANRNALDLRDQTAVRNWFNNNRPDIVILAAAKVGGILANSNFPAEFIYDNLILEANVIESSHRFNVDRLLFLGSSCIYPKLAAQPITENLLLTGPLEPTNEWYAIAKIAGIKLAQAYRQQYSHDYISAMPTNLYGPGDNYDLASSHVLPALIRKAHDAKIRNEKTLVVWGSGTPRREFLHVEDLADACVFLLQHYSDSEHINVGSGSDITIAQLAKLVANVVGLDVEIIFDRDKPDGTPRKLMDSSRIYGLGWQPRILLEDGIADSYADFLGRAPFIT